MNKFLSDFELVKRLQKGDVEAFDLIYDKYSGKLYLFCMKYLKSHEESEELIQSILLKINDGIAYGKIPSEGNKSVKKGIRIQNGASKR